MALPDDDDDDIIPLRKLAMDEKADAHTSMGITPIVAPTSLSSWLISRWQPRSRRQITPACFTPPGSPNRRARR